VIWDLVCLIKWITGATTGITTGAITGATMQSTELHQCLYL